MRSGRAPEPRAELQAVKSANCGLHLAYKLMSSALQPHVKILFKCTQPCWTWYANEVVNVKSPLQGLKQSMRMARAWSTELHLWETLRHSLYDARTLNSVGFTMDAGMLKPSLLTDMLMLTWHIVAHRAWSLSKHDFPPECCAPALSADDTQAQEATTKMRSDWANLMQLEQRAHTLASAMQLWQDIEFADARQQNCRRYPFSAAQGC